MPRRFAHLPQHVEALLAEHERVMVVLLDAFGWAFVERHADHPLLRALDAIEPMDAQFPSTTTAHVTTMHTGLPVGAHGLYEWNVLEPSLDRIVTPILASFAEGGSLHDAGFDPMRLLPDVPRLYERIGAPGYAFQPARFSPSAYDRVAARGARLRPFDTLEAGVRDAVAALDDTGGYAYVYWDWIDTTGHLHGPSSREFDAAVVDALDAVLAGLREARDVCVLFTADHGQVDVDPERTIWLDELHPPLAAAPLRPAGSARDVFLHVADVDGVVAALRDHVEAVPVADLLAEGAFGPDVGPPLLERLGSVCVLPPRGRMAWLRSAVDVASRFRGHHGGRTPEEMRTWLGTWVR